MGPGLPAFCPLVLRTPELERQIASDLSRRAREVVADVPRDVLARTSAFLLLRDSRVSYAIEGERPARSRVERWGRVIGEAGRHDLDEDEFLRLQAFGIGDARFVRLGFRQGGGFVGAHDRSTRMPLPDHVGARPGDVPGLVRGLLDAEGGRARSVDPVIAAAVFPVSAATLHRVDAFRVALASFAERLLLVVAWCPTPAFDVVVLNDTGDFYLPFRSLQQHGGRLSLRARAREFAALSDDAQRRRGGAYRDELCPSLR